MRVLLFVIFIFNSFLFGLSNEVLADKYLISAQKSVKEKNYKKAVESFEKIFSLGVVVPNDIYYFYAKSLKNSGDIIKAYDVFNKYIEKTGRGAKHYKDALGFIIDMEEDIIVKKREIKEKKLQEKLARQKAQREEKIRKEQEAKREEEAKKKESNSLNSKALKYLNNEKNYKKAFLLFKKALELNSKNGDTLCNIGYMYNMGLYVNRDTIRGLEYTKKSVQNGHCYNNLGYAYEFGEGMGVDYKEAIKLYKMAIKKFPKNSSRAYYHLGVMIAEGKGFVIDYSAAIKKFKLAQKYGDKDAIVYIKKLKKKIEDDKKAKLLREKDAKKSAKIKELKRVLDSYSQSKGYQNYPVYTYIDDKTGLMWEDQISKKQRYNKKGVLIDKYTFKEAKEYCANLTLAGFTDWRLPTLSELLTIMDYEEKSIKDMSKIDILRHELVLLLSNEKFKRITLDTQYEKVKNELYFAHIQSSFWSSSKYERDDISNKNRKIEGRWVANQAAYASLESKKNATICVRSHK